MAERRYQIGPSWSSLFGCFGLLLLVLVIGLLIWPFYWLYMVINGFVGIGVVSVLIEFVVIAGVVYGLYWLVRWLRAYVRNLPDPAKHAERLQAERERKSRKEES